MTPTRRIVGTAVVSKCHRYRYVLRRTWESDGRHILFVALNPSTADARVDDPTVRRCIGFAADWGFGGFALANLYAYRATDPTELTGVEDPIGPLNDEWLRSLSAEVEFTVAAWGANVASIARQEYVYSLLRNIHHLGLTKGGFPRHPLYLRRSVKPIPL